jgi:hypothetical protein
MILKSQKNLVFGSKKTKRLKQEVWLMLHCGLRRDLNVKGLNVTDRCQVMTKAHTAFGQMR